MNELFRQEAIKHQARRLDGEVVLANALSTKLLGGLLIAVVAGATAFAASGSYARKETVPGWITPDAGLIRVAARQGGVVEALTVNEGDQVQAGQPLATLRLSYDSSSGDAGASLMHDLSAEASADRAQAVAAREKIAAQRTQLIASRTALVRELDETRRRVAVLEERQALAQQQASRGEALLKKGFVTPAAMDNLRSSVLSAAQDASQTRAAALDYERQIGDIDHQLAALPADLATVEAQAAQSQAALSQRRVAAETQTTFVATAPVSGRVVAIPVERGQTVQTGGAVAVVTPKDSQLEAELYVPSRAAGFIKVGQEVRLMYQAFPYQTFGTGKGVVKSVSKTVLAPNEVAIPGLTVQEPTFRVRVALQRPTVFAYGHATPLQPGMLLTADVVIDRRNLLQWLLDPLYAVGRRG